MTFYVVTAWQGTTVLGMYIAREKADANRLAASLRREHREATRLTIEGPWVEGEDLCSEDRVFCTMYPD